MSKTNVSIASIVELDEKVKTIWEKVVDNGTGGDVLIGGYFTVSEPKEKVKKDGTKYWSSTPFYKDESLSKITIEGVSISSEQQWFNRLSLLTDEEKVILFDYMFVHDQKSRHQIANQAWFSLHPRGTAEKKSEAEPETPLQRIEKKLADLEANKAKYGASTYTYVKTELEKQRDALLKH